MVSQNVAKIESLKTLSLKKGSFTQVPNEMLDYFADRTDLTPTEYRICFVLMRELVGWDYAFKPIELITFSQKMRQTAPSQISKSLKSLIKKGVILREKVSGYRTPCYGFNPDSLGRVTVLEAKTQFESGSKVIDLKNFKVTRLHAHVNADVLPRQVQSDCLDNLKILETAARAETQVSKYPQIHLNTLSQAKSIDEKIGTVKEQDKILYNKSQTIDSVIAQLTKDYPGEDGIIFKAYRTIKENGWNGRRIEHVLAWLSVSYKDIRKNYINSSKKSETSKENEQEDTFTSDKKRHICKSIREIILGKQNPPQEERGIVSCKI